jgi:hypothetical protein
VPYNSRNPGSGQTAAHQYPIARWFAITVLTALGLLLVLRHLFGSIRVEAGTK